MRIRFFLIILTVLTAVSMAVAYIHASIVRRERLSLIDQQVRETASTLVDSELADLRKFNINRADKIISEELGESRLGKFFIVRNSKDEIIYQNSSAAIAPLQNIPRNPRWVTIHTNENYIRVLNLKLPSIPDRTLQVGVVISNEIVDPNYLSTATASLLLTALIVGSLASVILTSFLLKPIARLSEYISEASEQLRLDQILKPVPMQIADTRFIRPSVMSSNDEYKLLISGFNNLIDRVNRHYKSSKLWAYQMAHELKTPLTIMNLESESLMKPHGPESISVKAQSIQDELNKVSATITSFLSWAEIENSVKNKHLFANRLPVVIREIVSRIDPGHTRFEIKAEDDFTILSNPIHLEQLILNIMTNALKYSDASSIIYVTLIDNCLKVVNSGPEFPSAVLERLGEPFNKGSDHDGSGLGLAWVSSICKLYGWTLKIHSHSNSSTVEVHFSIEK